MITNLWQKTRFFCWNHPEISRQVMAQIEAVEDAGTKEDGDAQRVYLDDLLNRIELTVREGQSAFYACPRYMLADDAHPFGHLEDEPACPNVLSVTDAEKLLGVLSKQKEQMLLSGEYPDFTHYSFALPGIRATVIQERPHHLWIGVQNRAAIARRRGAGV